MTGPSVRTLVIADETAWPRDTGYRQRLNAVARALGALGPVSWAVVAAAGQDVTPPPPGLVDDSVTVLPAPWLSRGRAAARWGSGHAPHWVSGRDWSGARAVLGRSAQPPDLVWASHADVWAGVAPALPKTTLVVDLDNVMSAVAVRRAHRSAGPARLLLRQEARRWARLEQRVAAAADAVAVCSGLDAARVRPPEERPAPWVVPNGYDALVPLGVAPAGRPILLLVASFDYAPNADAAVWMAREALPRVRREVPGTVLRLVGRAGPAVEALRSQPGVEVVGRVDDVRDELAAATAVVCPVHWGGGTRIKVLEAFAARRPVVSTAVGCEGLDATPGLELLVADDAAAFAHCCVSLLRDAETAGRLADAGHSLWDRRFRWSTIEGDLVAHVSRLLSGSTRAGR